MSKNQFEATHSFKKKMTELEWLLGIFRDDVPEELLSCARFFEQAVTVPYSKSRPQEFYEYTNDVGQKFSCSLFRQANAEYVMKNKISWMEPASIKVPRSLWEMTFEEVWSLGEVNVNTSFSYEYAPASSLRKFAVGEPEFNSDSKKALRKTLEELEKDVYDGKISFPVSKESLVWQPQRKDELLARMEREVGALLGHQIVTHPSWSAALLGDSPTLPAKAKPGENKSVKDGEGRIKGQRPKPNPQSDKQKTSKSLDRSSTTQQSAANKASHLGFLQERFPKRAEELRQHALSGKKLSGEIKNVADKVNNLAVYFLAYQEADNRSDEDHYLGQINDTVKVHGVSENKAGMTDFEIMLGLMCAVDEFGSVLVLNGVVDETFGILVAHRDRRNT